jgi:hypothetical protein
LFARQGQSEKTSAAAATAVTLHANKWSMVYYMDGTMM